MNYRKIRKTLCHLRVRKDRVQVALSPDIEVGEKRLPTFYVKENELVFTPGNILYKTKDHGATDYMLWFYTTNNNKGGTHVPKKYIWTNICTLFREDMSDAELEDCIVIYRIVLDCYAEIVDGKRAESFERIFDTFKTIMYEHCRRKYIAEIKWYLDGNRPGIWDAVYIPMKNELLEEELRTLAHFAPEPFDLQSETPSDFHYTYRIRYKDFGGGTRGILRQFLRTPPFSL